MSYCARVLHSYGLRWDIWLTEMDNESWGEAGPTGGAGCWAGSEEANGEGELVSQGVTERGLHLCPVGFAGTVDAPCISKEIAHMGTWLSGYSSFRGGHTYRPTLQMWNARFSSQWWRRKYGEMLQEAEWTCWKLTANLSQLPTDNLSLWSEDGLLSCALMDWTWLVILCLQGMLTSVHW